MSEYKAPITIKPITVGQLIRHLSDFNQDAIVLIPDPEDYGLYKAYDTIVIEEKEVKKVDCLAKYAYEDSNENEDNHNEVINSVILYQEL